ncbi:MAG: reverse transcriptase domain-containing protein [bacterium]|nr:reverse transcriptase domain-containing protein [bacterium]
MDLFTAFSSKENLKKAFAYLKDETDESTLPLDPIWRPAISAVAQLGDEFFETLQEYIRQSKYQPDKADYIYADKDNMGVRPICVFSVVDRIVFQALLNPWILGNIIDKKLYSSCLGNRVLGKEKYLKAYKNQWSRFCDKQILAFGKRFIWRAEFDLQTYYESIHIETLTKILKESFQIQDERLLNILGQQLKTWAENLTLCGIPQGANASHILANAYLYPLDTFLDDLKSNGDFEYFRYADDIVLMAESADKINHIVSQIVIFLRQYALKLNEKSKLERLKNTESIEELKFYNPYGQLNETSQQKVAKISKKLPTILRKIKNGGDTKKTEISGLKYYLKAGANTDNPETFDDLISIIPKRPSLIYLICRYVGFYISDIDKDFYKTNKEIIRSKYGKVWKIYSGNSLTEWTKFWLLKVLSAPPFAKDHTGFQSELNKIITDPKAKFLRPLAFFYKAFVKAQIDPFEDLGFTSDDIKRHIRNAKTETEKAIYYYFAVYLSGVEENGMIRELLYEALQSKSPEIQTMGLFLVKKLYHLFEAFPDEANARNVVTKWNIKFERDIMGEFSRIYLKLPDRKPLKEKVDELFTKEGKIAQDKLAPFFGIPTPLKVVVFGSQEGLETIATKNVNKTLKKSGNDIDEDFKQSLFLLKTFYSKILEILDTFAGGYIAVRNNVINHYYTVLNSLIDDTLNKKEFEGLKADKPELFESLVGDIEEFDVEWEFGSKQAYDFLGKIEKLYILSGSPVFGLPDELKIFLQKTDEAVSVHRKYCYEQWQKMEKRTQNYKELWDKQWNKDEKTTETKQPETKNDTEKILTALDGAIVRGFENMFTKIPLQQQSVQKIEIVKGKLEVDGLKDGLKAISQSKKETDKPKFPYKLPAGTIWENFTIKFLNDENIFIQVKKSKHNASYKEMGFVGKGNNPNPSEAWIFLKVLAEVGGELTIKDPKARDTYKKQKELLAKSLQSYFSLEYDPFYPYTHYSPSKKRKVNSYEIKITLIPPPQTENRKPDIREDKDDLGLEEYLDEQAPLVNNE